MPDKTYELSNLEILSVGLVERGAVSIEDDEEGNPTGENFFLLKNKEGQMPDEVTIEEVPEAETPEEQPESTGDVENPETTETDGEAGQGEPEAEEAELEKSLFERFMAFVKAKTSKADPAAIKEAVQNLRAGGYNVTVAQLTEFLGGGEEEMEQSRKTTTEKSEVKMPDQPTNQPQGVDVEAILKAVEDKYQAQIQALVQKAETAETEAKRANERADKADEEKERRLWLQKAAEFRTLPQRTELGQKLFKFAQALEQEDMDWLTELLKANDAMLGAAGIFNTIGTTESPEQLEVKEKVVKKAQEEGTAYRDALLSLPAHEQAQLVDQILKGGK